MLSFSLLSHFQVHSTYYQLSNSTILNKKSAYIWERYMKKEPYSHFQVSTATTRKLLRIESGLQKTSMITIYIRTKNMMKDGKWRMNLRRQIYVGGSNKDRSDYQIILKPKSRAFINFTFKWQIFGSWSSTLSIIPSTPLVTSSHPCRQPHQPVLTDGALSTTVTKPNGPSGEFLSSSLNRWRTPFRWYEQTSADERPTNGTKRNSPD